MNQDDNNNPLSQPEPNLGAAGPVGDTTEPVAETQDQGLPTMPPVTDAPTSMPDMPAAPTENTVEPQSAPAGSVPNVAADLSASEPQFPTGDSNPDTETPGTLPGDSQPGDDTTGTV